MMNGMRGGSNAVGAGGGSAGPVVVGGGGVAGGSGLVVGGDVKYPANCAARISVETNSAAACADGSIDPGILDKLYEPKPNKKFMRVITVIGYIFTVSMVAILLSLYYLVCSKLIHRHTMINNSRSFFLFAVLVESVHQAP